MDETLVNNESSIAGRKIRFPWKLHYLLGDVEQKGQISIISWLPNGMGFKVHKKNEFISSIMPVYFNTNRYKSFQRNLNLWGFQRIRKGAFKGACYHPCFVRGNLNLCQNICRQRPLQMSKVASMQHTPAAASSVQKESHETRGCEETVEASFSSCAVQPLLNGAPNAAPLNEQQLGLLAALTGQVSPESRLLESILQGMQPPTSNSSTASLLLLSAALSSVKQNGLLQYQFRQNHGLP